MLALFRCGLLPWRSLESIVLSLQSATEVCNSLPPRNPNRENERGRVVMALQMLGPGTRIYGCSGEQTRIRDGAFKRGDDFLLNHSTVQSQLSICT